MATLRQKKRAKLIGKNSTQEAELIEAGYALSTARKQPPSVMKAKGWQELMDSYLPDEKLVTTHSEALEAMKIHGTNDNFIEIADHPTRIKAVELGYKLKGKTNEKNINVQVNNYVPILGDTEVYVPKDNSS